MHRIYPIIMSVLIITPLSSSHALVSFKPTHKEQQELRLLQERDSTKIKLAIIGAVVALGTAKMLHRSGCLFDFNELIRYLTER